MNDRQYPEESINLKIMAYLDHELPAAESAEVEQKIAADPDYRKSYNHFKKLKEVTGTMKFKILPDMYWDEYWQKVYNRLERGISWILISLGAIIVMIFAVWTAATGLMSDNTINPVLKIGIFTLLAGGVILFVSVLREKLMVRRVDKYKEVER